MRLFLSSLALLAAILSTALRAQELPSPSSHFGFEPGEDRKLLLWEDLVEWYELAAKSSDRLRMKTLGSTTEGRPLIQLIASSRSDSALSTAKLRQRKVAYGEIPLEDLEATLEEQPAVIYAQGTLHSTEIGASLTFLRLVHRLATGTDATTLRVLANCILVLVPSANPDGQDTVVNWYRSTLDTPYEGTSPPTLYHRFAGHDNNRDWYMLSLKETQLVSQVLYQEWFPEVVLDLHQMGGRGARIFVPPYADPMNPNLPPLLIRQLDLVGTTMAHELTRAGLSGIVQDVTFDNWWNGGARNVPYRHNMVGILTETASARLASPVWMSPGQVRGSGRGLPEAVTQGNFPDPWPGGWWRLSDIVRYQEVSSWAAFDLVAKNRQGFVLDFHTLAKRAIQKGRTEAPFAWVLPAGGMRDIEVARLVRNLKRTGVQIEIAPSEFELAGRRYPANSFVIRADQAFRTHAKDLLEWQRYPELKLSAKGEVIRPYDASGWTLPLQFGVECVPINAPLPKDLATVPYDPKTVVRRPSVAVSAGWWEIPAGSLKANMCTRDWLFSKYPMRKFGGKHYVKLPTDNLNSFYGFGKGEPVSRVDAPPKNSVPIKRLRIGLLRPWPEPMDGGWTRLVLEKNGFDPSLISLNQVSAGGLRASIDALVIPSVRSSALENGPGERLPKRFRGGLSREGVAELRRFVREGGRILAFGRSVDFMLSHFDLPVEDALAKRGSGAPKVVIPGTLLRAVHAGNNQNPLGIGDGYGLSAKSDQREPGEASFYVDRASALRIKEVKRGREQVPNPKASAVFTWPKHDLLQSGYIEGASELSGLSPLVTCRYGEGHIVLYAFRPQHRSQTLGTLPLIFDALN